MLKAILKGKAGRITDASGVSYSWRDLFKQREDMLTAVFFGRIRYLSEVNEKNVLSLLIGEKNAQHVGRIEEIVFWPKLSGLENRHFVEPDVLIQCEHATLLIEVKPPFGGMQSYQQWRDEILSLLRQRELRNSEFEVRKRINFVALGRNAKGWEKDVIALEADYGSEGVSISVIEWDDLSHGILKMNDFEVTRDSAVFQDWIEAFSLFGVVDPPKPFADLLKLSGKISKEWPKYFGPVLEKKSLSTNKDAKDDLLFCFSNLNLDISVWK